MPDKQTHIINKQILEIQLDERQNAFQIQNQIRALFETDINTMLEALCSDTAKPDEYIQIDRLDINIGALNSRELKKVFVEKVYENLKTTLVDRVSAIRFENKLFNEGRQTDIEKTSRGSPPVAGGERDDRKFSEVDYHLQLLHFFLQTGNLPWHQGTLASFSLQNTFSILFQKAPEKTKALLDDEMRHQVTRHRLIYQLPDDLLIEVLGLREPGRKEEIRKWLIDLSIISNIAHGIDPKNPENRLSFWDTLISGLQDSTWRNNLIDPDMSALLLAATTSNYWDSREAMFGALQQAVGRLSQSGIKLVSRLPEVINPLVQKRNAHGRPGRLEDQAIEPGADLSKDRARFDRKRSAPFLSLSKQDLSRAGRDNRLPEDPSAQQWPPGTAGITPQPPVPFSRASRFAADEKTPDRFQADETAPLQEVYVKNAGLVLLWPYFNNLFKQFKLLKKTGFVNQATRARAVHLLQYLATGKQEAGEFELPLNKLLCGWDLQAPMNKFIRITAEEQTECRKLLIAAITHWKALKKTSIENFQNSFLIRNGALQKKANGWRLAVEPRAYDLLLQRLPWGLSLIKLSWMPDILTVEWH